MRDEGVGRLASGSGLEVDDKLRDGWRNGFSINISTGVRAPAPRGRVTTRAEDAQGTPTQSRISLRIQCILRLWFEAERESRSNPPDVNFSQIGLSGKEFRAWNFGLGGQGWGVSLVLRFCAGPADLGDFCGRIVVYGVGRRFYGWEVCVWGFVSGGWGLVSGV